MLDEAQTQVELQFSEKELDDDIDKAADLRERSRRPWVRAAKLLAELLAQDNKEGSEKGSQLSGSRCSLDV